MIRAVFFDWSNTLATYVPSREELQSQALRELNINVTPQRIAPGLFKADKYLYEETAASPIIHRSREEQARVYTRYQQMLLTEIGADIPAGSADFLKLMVRLNELYHELKFVLYDDVLPALRSLKEKSLILALVTNMDRDMGAVCRELGLAVYLDFVITSVEVGASKPRPKIFQTALESAGVTPSEAVHVGDQYEIDVAGALGAGIQPILIDRNDLFPQVTVCPRIHSLSEVVQYLE